MNKFLSARFLLAMMVGLTYCLSIIGTLVLVLVNKIEVAVFLGVFSGFASTAAFIITSYFERKDRKYEKDISSNIDNVVIPSNN